MEENDPVVTTEIITAAQTDTTESTSGESDTKAYIKRLRGENRELRSRAMTADLESIGLNAETGLGVAVAEGYKGDFSAGDVAEFARTKYGHEVAQVPAPETVQMGDRVDQMAGVSTPVDPTPVQRPGQEAIDQMDGNDPDAGRTEAQASIAAKMGQFQDRFYNDSQQ